MKKYILTLTGAALLFQMNAQKDSLKKLHFSGIQIDYGFVGSVINKNLSQQDYQKFVSSNSLLNKNFSPYTYNNYGGLSQLNYNSFISARAFASIKSSKKIQKEIFVGLRYGQELISYLNYYKQTYDTIGTYIDLLTNDVITKVKSNQSSYNFSINCNNLIIPLGINITTNKNRWFWFTAGVEIAPSITFGYVFTANNSENSSTLYLESGAVIEDELKMLSFFNTENSYREMTNKLKHVGVGGSAAIPLAINLRLGKKFSFLKHLNLSATVAPMLVYASNKYTSFGLHAVINTNVGLRYQFK
jgi:hypothetical protein